MTRNSDIISGIATLPGPATGGRPLDKRADHDLTVVIPAYNEEDRLPWTLQELGRFLDAWGLDYRVLVADDGSRDRTPTLTRPFGRRFSTVSLPQNRGKGAAVRTAMLQATGAVVAFTDADLPYELSGLRDGFEQVRAGGCEVVFGARDLERSAHHAKRKLSRTLATWVFREVVRRLVSRDVTDTQCGLKVFSLRAVQDVFSRTTLDGFSFDAEVVYLTQRLGLAYRRIPVNLVREYSSTLSLRRDTLPMLADIVGLWWRHRVLGQWPLRQPQPQTSETIDKKQAA